MDTDPDPEPITFLCILVFIALTAFSFAVTLGSAALSSASEKKVREKAEDGDRKSQIIAKLLEKRTSLSDTASICVCLSAMLIDTAALLNFVIPLARVFNGWFSFPETRSGFIWLIFVSSLAITVIATAAFLTVGVILPKKLGSQNSEKSAQRLAGFMMFSDALFLPLRAIVCGISKLLIKVFGGDPHYEDAQVTEDEILSMVDAGEEKGVIEESQKEMINNIFEFNDLTAGDVMTHRTEIEAVEASDDMSEVVAKAIEEGYSRLPVYEEDPDNIKGIVYVKDLLKYVGNAVPADLKPSDIMREAMFIPESKKCRDLFSEMTEKHLQMVIVADEYGGVAGIVTVEDLLEAIVGNIQDEFDDEQQEFEQISEDVYNIDGTLDIHEVEELLGIEFPEGEYDTVAGFIMSIIGKIPDADEHPTVEYEGYAFTVAEMDDRRIVRIVAERLPEEDETDEDKAQTDAKD